MTKINIKIEQSAKRYFRKNTVHAKYDRNMDAACLSGLAVGGEMFKIPHWEPHDIGLTAFFGSLFLRSVSNAMKHLINLQPVRKRAIQIKKAAKLAKNQ